MQEPVVSPSAQPLVLNRRHRFLLSLTTPLADRLVAAIACLPMVMVIILRLKSGQFDLPEVALLLEGGLPIIALVVRRPPARVSVNLWYWLVAFLGTYWPILSVGLVDAGRPLTAAIVVNVVAVLSLIVALWSRLSLGRNLGIVPAQRRLVTTGAYRFVRHPIYTSVFIAYLALVLSAWSPLNGLQAALGCFWLMIRSVLEERFLSADPSYRAYRETVKWRWLPGIA